MSNSKLMYITRLIKSSTKLEKSFLKYCWEKKILNQIHVLMPKLIYQWQK